MSLPPLSSRMRLFLFDFSSPLSADVARGLRRFGHEIVYWTGCKDRFDQLASSREFPETFFHSTFDAIQAKPAPGIDAHRFEPVGVPLKEQFLDCETITLAMMNRADFMHLSFSEKQQLYYRILGYWHGLLKQMHPDALIFIDIPHAIYNFVAYAVAKHLGIKTLMFQITRLPDRLLVTTDFHAGSDRIREALLLPSAHGARYEDLNPDIRAYLQEQFDPSTEPTPFDTRELQEKAKQKIRFMPPAKNIWKNLLQGSILRTTRAYLKAYHCMEGRMLSLKDDGINYKHQRYRRRMAPQKQRWQKTYASLTKPANFSLPFVYVPLHYQPENSTSPAGHMFVDQIQMVRILSAALPPDWHLYVKEHLTQWNPADVRANLGRYEGYYEQLAAIPHVTLVDAGLSSFQLINASRSVATVTGTPGWEALLRNKPVLLFGAAWYAHAEGALHVHDVATTAQAFQRILDGYAPNRQSLLDYVAVLDRVCIKGFQQQTIFQRVSRIPYETNIQNLVMALQDELSPQEKRPRP